MNAHRRGSGACIRACAPYSPFDLSVFVRFCLVLISCLCLFLCARSVENENYTPNVALLQTDIKDRRGTAQVSLSVASFDAGLLTSGSAAANLRLLELVVFAELLMCPCALFVVVLSFALPCWLMLIRCLLPYHQSGVHQVERDGRPAQLGHLRPAGTVLYSCSALVHRFAVSSVALRQVVCP